MSLQRNTAQNATPEAYSLPPVVYSSLILVAVTYFAGWMYLYYFLRPFGVSVSGIDIPLYYVFAYAFAVLTYLYKTSLANVIIALSLFMLGMILCVYLYNSKRIAFFLASIFIGFTAITAAFIGVFFGAREAGSFNARAIRTEGSEYHSSIAFEENEKRSIVGPRLAEQLSALRPSYGSIVVFETPQELFLLLVDEKDYLPQDILKQTVIRIRRDQITLQAIAIPALKLTTEY